ncbi:hypothetical protein [Bacillus sp. 1P06AnD]|uniref:hypothetical protein n=1 Tax=Bacillus sp. 1P06AnD TaxID=3132208 RepID=UPI00399F8FAF
MNKEESYWGEHQKENAKNEPSIYDEMILVPWKIKDIEIKLEMIKGDLDNIEILRARQYEQLTNVEKLYKEYMVNSDYPGYKEMLKKKGHSVVEATSLQQGKILKIRLDYILPKYQKNKNNKFAFYEALQDVYRKDILECIYLKRESLPSFKKSEKVFILIVQYFNSRIIADLDNRFHSIIFNSLRSALVIPDDNWKRLSYMEDGRLCESKPYTEVFVGDYKNMLLIIQESKLL